MDTSGPGLTSGNGLIMITLEILSTQPFASVTDVNVSVLTYIIVII